MRSRTLGICIAASLALCAATASPAAAAGAKLWLLKAPETRATPGEAVHMLAFIGECTFEGGGELISNGRAVDRMLGGPAVSVACPQGEKLAGTMTKFQAAYGTGTWPLFQTGVRDDIRLQFEPWCTYKLPPKFTGEPQPVTSFAATLQATLDKGASFGTCPATREVQFALNLWSEGFSFYEAEPPPS